MKNAVPLTAIALAAILGVQPAHPAAAADDEPREGGSSPAQRYPSDESERTPENVRGYDASPHLLDIAWEYQNGWRIEGEPVRVGSRTLTVKSHGRPHRLAIDRLTEQCKERARQFQVMGHIEPLPLPPEQRQVLNAARVCSYRYVRGPGNFVNFLLYSPVDARRGGGEHPLLLFLSGSGGAGRDNFRQWTDAHGIVRNLLSPRFQNHLPFYVMIPQADDPDHLWIFNSGGVPPRDDDGAPLHTSEPALELAVQAIDVLKGSRMARPDMKRLYVTGLSAGAYGCFGVLQSFPGKFAAAVPVQGSDPYPFFNQYNARPMWMVFNRNGEWGVSLEDAEALARRYKALHVEMQQRRLPGTNYDAWMQAYPEMAFRDWLARRTLSRVTYPSDWRDPVPAPPPSVTAQSKLSSREAVMFEGTDTLLK